MLQLQDTLVFLRYLHLVGGYCFLLLLATLEQLSVDVVLVHQPIVRKDGGLFASVLGVFLVGLLHGGNAPVRDEVDGLAHVETSTESGMVHLE